MNRHSHRLLFNNPPTGGIIGSKHHQPQHHQKYERILTSTRDRDNDNFLDGDFRSNTCNNNSGRMTTTTMTMPRGGGNGNNIGLGLGSGRANLLHNNSNSNNSSNRNGTGIDNGNGGGSMSIPMNNQLSMHLKKLNEECASFPGDPLGQISEITESLYLCGARGLKAAKVRALGITTIFNITVDLPNLQMDKVENIKIPIEDSPVTILSVYFDKVADKIDDVVRRGGKVLVHCMAGISRSASLCIAYLMKYKRMSLRRAFRHCKAQRQIVHPNPGFFRQLIDYEMKLFGTTTMSIAVNAAARRADPDIYQSSENFSHNHNHNHNHTSISSPPPLPPSQLQTNKTYRTYISRPLELPVRIIHKYGRQ